MSEAKTMLCRDEINTGRQPELDTAKAFAVLFMITVHVLDNMSDMGGTVLPTVIEFLGCPPAAGVFMFAMGVGMVYTRHSTPKAFAVRGVKLLLMGYALNFFRETLLVMIGSWLQIENDYEGQSLFSTLMTVDILQFAGAAFLIAALLKKLSARPWLILAVSLALHAAGNLCVGLFEDAPETVQYPLGVLLFTNEEIAFPAFQWLVYPAAGMCFGQTLKRVADKDRFYRAMAAFSAAALVCATVGCVSAGKNIIDLFMTSAYYRQDLLTTLWCLSVVALCIPIYYAVSKRLRGRAAAAVKYVSTNVNTIYILQWLVITYSIAAMQILDAALLPTAWVIPLGLVIAAACVGLTALWNRVKDRFKKAAAGDR